MAAAGKLGLRILCSLCILLVLTVPISGRGGRGGGGRGGSRFSRGGSRGSTSRVSRGSRFGGLNWKTAAAAGYIYGYTRYSHRRRYISSPDNEPTICRNTYDHSMANGTHFTYFICPMADQPESYTYCCGPENRQKCCSFGDSPGRVAGVVIGVLAALGITAGCVYCCCCRKKTEKEGTVFTTGSTINKPPSYPVAGATAGAPHANGSLGKPGNGPSAMSGYTPVPTTDAKCPVPTSGPTPDYPQTNHVFPIQPEGPKGPYPPTGYPAQDGIPPTYPVQPGGPAYPPQAGMYPPQDGMNNPNQPPMGMPPPGMAPPMGMPPPDGMPPPAGMPYPPGPAPYPPQDNAYPPAYPVQPAAYNIPPDNTYPSAPPPPYQPPPHM